MSVADINLQEICGGGNHITLRLTVGAQTFDFPYMTDEVLGPIDQDMRRTFVLVASRFHCLGMTNAEARAAMQAGITVTTSS